MTNKQKIAFNIMQGILALVFLAEGFTKLFGVQFQVDAFMRWGYPSWFMYIVGTFEVIGAIGLFTHFRKYAVLGLTALMAGAIYTHLTHGEAKYIGLALLMVILLWVSSWLKKKGGSTSVSVQSM